MATAPHVAAQAQDDHRTGEVPRRHRFAFIGIMDGEPDLASRSAQILRDELGGSSG
jgi:hypothetical protein